mmetsp:Transcript_184387/g.584820  ORF Transcript_184387/g.584820 Transcript_184387/m.584820 type:complete len:241 (-) Transcript_184387:225-947(-)
MSWITAQSKSKRMPSLMSGDALFCADAIATPTLKFQPRLNVCESNCSTTKTSHRATLRGSLPSLANHRQYCLNLVKWPSRSRKGMITKTVLMPTGPESWPAEAGAGTNCPSLWAFLECGRSSTFVAFSAVGAAACSDSAAAAEDAPVAAVPEAPGAAAFGAAACSDSAAAAADAPVAAVPEAPVTAAFGWIAPGRSLAKSWMDFSNSTSLRSKTLTLSGNSCKRRAMARSTVGFAAPWVA